MDQIFSQRLQSADFAYQPIISMTSLQALGFEALARFPNEENTACDLLDEAALYGKVGEVDLGLVKKAIAKFVQFDAAGSTRLFCNLDNRSYEGSFPGPKQITDFLTGYNLTAQNLCLEISERGRVQSPDDLMKVVERLTSIGMNIALDDFGVGVSSLHMLMLMQPHYVKIDRAFIDQIANDTRKQAIVSKLCGLAHALGFNTVAECVESERDFRMVRDLGCDFAQGYHIARPTTDIRDLTTDYGRATSVIDAPNVDPRVVELLTPVEPLMPDDLLLKAVECFKQNPDLRAIPVIDERRNVLGAVMEEDARRYLLSDFGPALLTNKGAAPRIASYIKRFPLGKARGTVEAIVNSYVASESSCGLILVNDGEYVGYLNNHGLLRLASERELSRAREQNPLTHLPGNRSIGMYIETALASHGPGTFVYFDFDNFKAFNDSYGFAAGDRALMIFADLLRGFQRDDDIFIGHVGGDDFFCGMPFEEDVATRHIRELCARFKSDAESLYSAEDRRQGGVLGVDRYGAERLFPLLRVSASILPLPEGRGQLTVSMVNERLSAGKKQAKMSSAVIAGVRLPERPQSKHVTGYHYAA